jgi:hypothetical protein
MLLIDLLERLYAKRYLMPDPRSPASPALDFLSPSQQSSYSRQQLLEIEWFGQVVVLRRQSSPVTRSFDAIPGGQHKHRLRDALLAQFFTYLKSVPVRNHYVKG